MTKKQHQPAILTTERGQAATEVVLSLPFFLVVMILGVNFGKATLLQQRAIVAARYAAWHEARVREPLSQGDLQQANYGGNHMQLITRNLGEGNRGADSLSRGGEIISVAFSSLYSTLPETTDTVAAVSYRWHPLGRILPDAQPSGAHTLSLEDWRHEPGSGSGVMDALHSSSLGWIIRVIGF